MPKKYEFKEKEFLVFFAELLALGYQHLSEKEVKEMIATIADTDQRFKLRKQERGIETGFYYRKSNFPISVIVWTTYLAREKRARESDAGWVLLYDSRRPNEPILYSFPVRRTKNFFATMKKYAKTFMELLDRWPEACPSCGKVLTIDLVRGGEMHASKFACIDSQHKISRTYLWQNLPKQESIFIQSMFRRYAKYVERERTNGTFRIPARVLRSRQGKGDDGNSSNQYSQVNPKAEEYPFNDLQYEI